MTRDAEYLDHLEGLARTTDGQYIASYLVTLPSAKLARQIIEGLPANRSLQFFDPFYPSPSDPGAYISVRHNDGRFAYTFGNHGWSTHWQIQSKEFLAQYLLLCLPAHSADSAERLRVSPDRDLPSVLK